MSGGTILRFRPVLVASLDEILSGSVDLVFNADIYFFSYFVSDLIGAVATVSGSWEVPC